MNKIYITLLTIFILFLIYPSWAYYYYYPPQFMGYYYNPGYYPTYYFEDIYLPDYYKYNATMINITTASTTAPLPEDASTRRTCNIWCWIRRVGLFIVQQLLADNT